MSALVARYLPSFSLPSPYSLMTQAKSHTCSTLLKSARILEKPFWWCNQELTRAAVRPLEGNFGERAAWAFLALSAVPVSLTCGIISLIPRSMALYLQNESFTYCKGEAKEKNLSGNSFSLLTLNACCMPGGLPFLFGGMTPASERVDKIAEKILQEDADVVCLQEIHDEQAAFKLIEGLKHCYAHFYFNIGPLIAGQNSGLFIASKYATEQPSFTAFNSFEGKQRFVNKGFFDFFIKNQDRRIAHIFNTHLQPSKIDTQPTPAEKIAREKQLKQMMEKVNKFSKEIPLQLMTGDFNIIAGSEEYKSSLISKELQDISSEVTSGTWSEAFENKDRAHVFLKLDYTLLKGSSTTASCKTKLVSSFDLNKPKEALSDHHGLITVVNF